MSPASTLLRPGSLAEAREAMRDSAARGDRVEITGAGTAAGWGGPAGPVEATLTTTGLGRVLDHRPGDLTVRVQAGLALRALREALAPHRQWVALDAARVGEGATVGGLIATGDAGPARLAYGSLRDQVIGVTVVLADGVVARSGGQVIKNVAGYDLAKLFCGSLGTLGLVAEVVLRLQPLPAATGTLRVPVAAGPAFALAGRLQAAGLEPQVLEWYAEWSAEAASPGPEASEDPGPAGTLLARFAGTVRGVAARGEQARRLAGPGATWHPDPSPAAETPPAGTPAAGATAAGTTILRVGTRPSAVAGLAGRIRRLAAARPVTVALASTLPRGAHRVLITGAAGARAEFVTGLREALREHPAGAAGGGLTICRWGEGLAGRVPAWADPPPAAAAMRAVRRAFDPERRLAPERFAPWL